MSKRRQAGEIVMKRENAGFLGVRCRVRIEPEDDPDPCFAHEDCTDPECREWANLAILDENDKVVSYCYHVSECEMEDIELRPKL